MLVKDQRRTFTDLKRPVDFSRLSFGIRKKADIELFEPAAALIKYSIAVVLTQ